MAFPTSVVFLTTPLVSETTNAPAIAPSDVNASNSFDILTGLVINVSDIQGRVHLLNRSVKKST